MTSGAYVIAALVGLLFGSAVAAFNTYLSKRYLKKNEQREGTESMASVMGLNFLRLMIDALALTAVFFTRNLLPLPYYVTLAGTAVGLTVVSYFLLVKFLK